jgi:hypothetical protein
MSPTTIAADRTAEEANGGFADRVRSAVIWRWGSQVASQLVTWAVTIIIVRLLDPHDYGLFAMTAAVLAAFNFLSGWGFANSLIPAERINQRQVGQVFGMLLLSNGGLAIAQFLAAPLAAAYYHQPMVGDMLRLQAVDEELKLLFESGDMSPDAQRRGQFLQAERRRLKAQPARE